MMTKIEPIYLDLSFAGRRRRERTKRRNSAIFLVAGAAIWLAVAFAVRGWK